MNFYIKNIEKNEKILLEDQRLKTGYNEIKEFILNRKHAMGYIDEKYDDFVLLVFPTRRDITHFELHYKMELAVKGLALKTEEGYELISLNIDDMDTHLEFIKTPMPPSVSIEIQPVFKEYYNNNEEMIKNLLIIIGSILLEVNL